MTFGAIQSVAVLSTTDVFALVAQYGESDVYHFTRGSWQKLVNLSSNDIFFNAVTIVADSDTDVWVTGEDERGYPYTITSDARHFDGSTWDHVAMLSPEAEILAAALGNNGVLYVVGSILGPDGPNRGLVWAYGGSGWSDLTPPSPRYRYDAVAVTPGGTLVVGASNGLLQERSGTRWTTVRLSAPVTAVTGISVSPDGTVYAIGAAGKQPVLIQQRPGSQSASVLDAPAVVSPAPSTTTETGVVAAGQGDVWLLGTGVIQQVTNYIDVPWLTHFDGRRFITATAPDFFAVGGVPLGRDILAYGAIQEPGIYQQPQTFIAVCPVQVTRDAIVPAAARTSIGGQMFWSVPATMASRHRLVARGIFDSGPIGPGGSFAYSFFAAATYAIKDTDTGATQAVGVPPVVTPAGGVTSTVYTVTCAALQAPAGYAYRVLIRPPGSPRYALLTTTSQPATTFLPYQGTGAYRFECQVQTPAGVTAASPPAAVPVSLATRPGTRLRRQASPRPGPVVVRGRRRRHSYCRKIP